MSRMKDALAKWDKGEFTYNKAEEKLLSLKDGEKLGDVLSQCTICPVGNATCNDFIMLSLVGFHPDKKELSFTK